MTSATIYMSGNIYANGEEKIGNKWEHTPAETQMRWSILEGVTRRIVRWRRRKGGRNGNKEG